MTCRNNKNQVLLCRFLLHHQKGIIPAHVAGIETGSLCEKAKDLAFTEVRTLDLTLTKRML